MQHFPDILQWKFHYLVAPLEGAYSEFQHTVGLWFPLQKHTLRNKILTFNLIFLSFDTHPLI